MMPRPISGSVRKERARKALKSWPPTAWRSFLAAMKRCAVMPSPAVGDPAKNSLAGKHHQRQDVDGGRVGGVCRRPVGAKFLHAMEDLVPAAVVGHGQHEENGAAGDHDAELDDVGIHHARAGRRTWYRRR